MSDYAIFFDYDNTTYRLPVNPEQIQINTVQAIERYEILKLGQIAVPTHMDLKEYSFEAELPHTVLNYVETSGDFRDSDYYLNRFEMWRDDLRPIRFIASNGIGDDINTLVLIQSLNITEKAGEEGDKYVSFSLLEYREFGKKKALELKKKGEITSFAVKSEAVSKETNPKSKGYHVVQSGDTLWAIAKKYYGSGSQYPKIFNANKDKIKNPNLIYPGQRLVIPA